ncbi:MAG TPA: ArgE/DapE family deacylase [Chloroflexi bacterium]|nr:ArgE/DapE family deacylase [Chloroflexota bacterium]
MSKAQDARNLALSSTEASVLDYVVQHRDELLQLLSDLIAIPTPNPPGDDYKAFCDFTADWLRAAGLEVKVMAAAEESLADMLRPEAEGQRYAVLACLKGTGGHPTLCLQGHYDTVPASGDWEIDPYDPQVVDGKLYGLGSTDMKGGLACMMMAAKALAHEKVPLRGDLYFLTTPDEEFPSGAGLAYFLDHGIVEADFAVVGEPSGIDNIHIGMKGGIWGDIVVHGKAVHGSRPFEGVNAFEKMVSVASAIQARLYPLLAERTSKFDFHPAQGNHPTLTLGGLVSGTNASRATVPDTCRVSFDRRLIPEEDLDEAEAELVSFLKGLEKEDRDLSLEIRLSSRAPAMVIPDSCELVEALSGAIGDLSGAEPTRTVSCGGFETALFVDRGVQALTYGPGVEGCAHAAGEHTLVGDLAFATRVYALTALRILS